MGKVRPGENCHVYGLRQSRNFEEAFWIQVQAEFTSTQNYKVQDFSFVFMISISALKLLLISFLHTGRLFLKAWCRAPVTVNLIPCKMLKMLSFNLNRIWRIPIVVQSKFWSMWSPVQTLKQSLWHWLCLNYVFLSTEKETDEWTPWSPCSVTCGHGERKRTKSCGYSCTLTEASKCDLEPCPGEILFPF